MPVVCSPKTDTLNAECLLHNPHVVCITETWLDNCISDNEISVPNYKIIRLDRSRHGGGVAIYVDSMFTYSILFTANPDFECVIASLCANNSKFYVCFVYRPPNSSISVLDNLFTTLCSLNVCSFSNFVMVGDFNIDFSNQNHPLFSKFHSIASSFLLYQVVKDYTHINLSGNHTTIDLAFVSSLELLISCTTVPPLSSSDHLGFKLCFYITLPRHLLNCVSKTVWCYQEADFEKANNFLSQLQWDCLVNDQHGVDTSWMNWYNHFTHTMSECIPKKRIISDNRPPWISDDILKAIRRRNRLFAAYKKSGNKYKLVEYKYTRNAIVSAIRVSKVKFFQKLHTADKKSFWKIVKRLTNNCSTIPTLIHN